MKRKSRDKRLAENVGLCFFISVVKYSISKCKDNACDVIIGSNNLFRHDDLIGKDACVCCVHRVLDSVCMLRSS